MKSGRFVLNKEKSTFSKLLSMESSSPNVAIYAKGFSQITDEARILKYVVKVGDPLVFSTVGLTGVIFPSCVSTRAFSDPLSFFVLKVFLIASDVES